MIFGVTKRSGRNGDSWLKRMPEQAYTIGFAVVGDLPEGGGLGDGVWAAGAEGGIFVGRGVAGIAEAFAGTGVVESNIAGEEADAFEQVEGADADAFEGFYRLFERQADGALPGQVVDFVGFEFGQHLQHAAKVAQCHGGKFDLCADAEFGQVTKAANLGIARNADDAVALLQKQFGKVRAILAGDAADQSGARCVHWQILPEQHGAL